MSDLARLLNLAAQLYAGGRGDAEVVLDAGTVQVPLRLVGYDRERNQISFALMGAHKGRTLINDTPVTQEAPMPIRCRECEATGLPHGEHCTPPELAALRQLCTDDAARNERMRSHGPRPKAEEAPQ